MPSNTVNDLERVLAEKGYTIAKKYDSDKGICTVTVKANLHDTVIVTKNSSNAPLWNAYRRALELALTQINEFYTQWGKNP